MKAWGLCLSHHISTPCHSCSPHGGAILAHCIFEIVSLCMNMNIPIIVQKLYIYHSLAVPWSSPVDSEKALKPDKSNLICHTCPSWRILMLFSMAHCLHRVECIRIIFRKTTLIKTFGFSKFWITKVMAGFSFSHLLSWSTLLYTNINILFSNIDEVFDASSMDNQVI